MIRVRKMRAEDAAEAAALEAQIFSQPWSEKGFLDALNLPNTIFLVAKEDGALAGYIGMYISLDEGEITNVAVAPQFRRRGVGTQLIEEIRREAAAHGVTSIVLEVRVSNEGAILLYEKCGFRDCGVRRGFYELPKEDARIMVCRQ